MPPADYDRILMFIFAAAAFDADDAAFAIIILMPRFR